MSQQSLLLAIVPVRSPLLCYPYVMLTVHVGVRTDLAQVSGSFVSDLSVVKRGEERSCSTGAEPFCSCGASFSCPGTCCVCKRLAHASRVLEATDDLEATWPFVGCAPSTSFGAKEGQQRCRRQTTGMATTACKRSREPETGDD